MYLSINASQRLEICEAAFDGLFDQTAFTEFTVTEVKTQVLGKYFSNKTSSLFWLFFCYTIFYDFSRYNLTFSAPIL